MDERWFESSAVLAYLLAAGFGAVAVAAAAAVIGTGSVFTIVGLDVVAVAAVAAAGRLAAAVALVTVAEGIVKILKFPAFPCWTT